MRCSTCNYHYQFSSMIALNSLVIIVVAGEEEII
jgi:hypothetical protein